MPEILPRFQRDLQRIEDMRKIASLLLEVEAESHPDSNGRVYRRSADGHSTDRRRGDALGREFSLERRERLLERTPYAARQQ